MSRPTCIRITMKYFEEGTNLIPTILRCTPDVSTALIVLEHEPYDHIHAFIYADLTEKPIREKIYKLTADRGNQVLSVSPVKKAIGVQGFCSYLVKQSSVSILHIGSQIDLPALKSYYQKVATNSVSRKSKILEIEKFIFSSDKSDKSDNFITPQSLCKNILDYYCDQAQPINRAFVGQLATTIYLRTYPQYRYHAAKEIISQHVPEMRDLPKLQVSCGVPRGFNTKFNPTLQHLEDLSVQKDLSLFLDDAACQIQEESVSQYDLEIE